MKQKSISAVYQVVNKVNGKSYVGSSNDINARFRSHKAGPNSKAYSHRLLYQEMQKYGFENFDFKVLEEVSKDKLLKRESYWYNKLNPEYCTATPDGVIEEMLKPVYQIEKKTLKILKEFSSTKEAERSLGIGHGAIINAAKKRTVSAGGYHWCYVDAWTEDFKPKKDAKSKRVLQILNGKVINEFDSMREAERKTGIKRSNIHSVVNNRTSTAGGYKWQYK